MIDSNNYTYCCYENNNHKAIISFGMDPDNTSGELDYFVTVVKDQDTQVVQFKHQTLDDACNQINTKYSSIWQFNNMTLKNASSGGGCSTCVAH